MKTIRMCRFCGKEFVARNGMQKFCCEECQTMAEKARKKRQQEFMNAVGTFFSVPIWSGRMSMHSMTLIIAFIARFLSFSEKKLLKSEIIVVPLLTASKFVLYCLAIVKLFIFSELSKLRSPFCSYFMLNYAGAPSLAKL